MPDARYSLPGRLGKYELRRKLGEGATSEVYLGYDAFAQRDVAVKIVNAEKLRDRDLGPRYQQLFLNEASLAGRLIHPNIVQIHDAVVDDDCSYIVMEYVAGKTLDAYCVPDNLLPVERLVEIVFKCTRALDYAAQLGITHRDIKPANILVSDAGEVKVSDFGSALMTTVTQMRLSGIGSPAYMSPQQLRDKPLDQQTDIYSVGVVMYQLLTGRLPFRGAGNQELVHQILHEDPPPPSSLRAEVPSSLDAIVARAMHKTLAVRYNNWSEFSRDLTQAFRNQYLRAQGTEVPDSEKFETLRAMPFCAEFSDVALWEVVRLARWEHIAPDTKIMKDGEPGDFFCLMAAGEAKVVKRGRLLNLLVAGDCFGEMAVIGRKRNVRAADVIAVTDARVITIRAADLAQASDACRMHFYLAFLEVLAGRLEGANSRLAAIRR